MFNHDRRSSRFATQPGNRTGSSPVRHLIHGKRVLTGAPRMSNAPPSPGNRMAQVTQTPAFDRRVWLLALAFFAIGTDFNVVSGILPSLARSLDVSVPAAGQVVSSYALFYAVCAPV